MRNGRMLRLKRVLGGLLLLFTLQVHAETATKNSVKELFTVSGQEAQLIEGVQTILPLIRQISKDMPEELLQELTGPEAVLHSVIPIYQKYFSEEEIQELITFYKTPVGSKYARLAGAIQRESMDANTRAGRMTVINYQIQKGKFTLDPPKK